MVELKIIIKTILLSLITCTAFSTTFVIDNQTLNPIHRFKSNIAIQWANSAKDIERSDRNTKKMLQKDRSENLMFITQTGKIKVKLPEEAEYFRVLVWSGRIKTPSYITNWVNIVPNKIYTLNTEHLIPIVLTVGMGC